MKKISDLVGDGIEEYYFGLCRTRKPDAQPKCPNRPEQTYLIEHDGCECCYGERLLLITTRFDLAELLKDRGEFEILATGSDETVNLEAEVEDDVDFMHEFIGDDVFYDDDDYFYTRIFEYHPANEYATIVMNPKSKYADEFTEEDMRYVLFDTDCPEAHCGMLHLDNLGVQSSN